MSPLLIVTIIVAAILYGWLGAIAYGRARKQYNLFGAIFTGLLWIFIITIFGSIMGMVDAVRALFCKEKE